MTPDDIRSDIAAFADDEEGVLVEKGLVIFQRDRQDCELKFWESSPGNIDVEFNGRKLPYFRFLAEELGRLSVVAQSIRQKRKDVLPYTDTKAVLSASLGADTLEGSGLDMLKAECEKRIPGETRLIFLTADAGEGKTALLRRLTQQIAEEYEKGRASSLLLHIDTQGRSFVRLEEAVARELGQLRVSGLFYSGVVRLIKRGLLTIAIDGFDELLAEIGSSEAYSGLGAFLKQLGGTGVVIAAARTAYFEAENYTAQTSLLSRLPGVQVTVEQMKLLRWGRKETVGFFAAFRNEAGTGIPEPEGLYDELAQLVGDDHVILHRPFLVSTMAIMLASTPASAEEIIRDIGGSGLQVVPAVIRAFLRREVEEKWRDPSGQPYLTLEQHVRLLAAIADEMWTQLAKSLPTELVQLVAETVVDDLKLPLARRVQVIERVKAHVLLPVGAANRPDHRAFDHDEFLNYFLAVRLCELLKTVQQGFLRRFLERSSLPTITAKWASVIDKWSPAQVQTIVAELSKLSSLEVRSTYLKQNAGLVSARLASVLPDIPGLAFESMYFEGDDWTGSFLKDASFARCDFNGADLSDCSWTNCQFTECQIQGITINQGTSMQNSAFDERCRVVGLRRIQDSGESMRLYVPEECEEILVGCGARFLKRDQGQLKLEIRKVPEETRAVVNRFLRIFSRSSGVTENVLRLKLGPKLHFFKKEVLPAMLEHKVIQQAEYIGSGSQERYELSYPIDTILSAEDPESAAPDQLKTFWEVLRR